MRGRYIFLLAYYLGWVILFQCARLVFLLYHWGKAAGAGFSTMASSFWYGLRMDLAMGAYLLLPVCIFVLASLWLPFFRKKAVYLIYTCLLLLPIILAIIADLEVYGSWGFRIDTTPLQYLSSPKEVWASVSHLPLLLIFLGFLCLYLGACFLFNRLLNRLVPLLKTIPRRMPAVAGLLVFTGLLIIPLRGGLQLTPLNQSSVYFSKNNFANVTAINAVWNLVHAMLNNPAAGGNPYNYMPGAKAAAITDSLLRSSVSPGTVLRTEKPNVILVIWESFTEKATHAIMDGQPVTPRFNELKKEGIYFSELYASGDRTDKGIAAVLSGYPALNKKSVIRLPHKSAKLPTLSRFFKEKGYGTSFYYGGEPEFANIKSYILQGGFDGIVEKSDFSAKDQNSKWGAHDGVVADRLLRDLNRRPDPFFVTWLTLTSHEPFETPEKPAFNGSTDAIKFQNSLRYTDEVLYRFVASCRRQPWWDNTLLVIIADHGHPLIEPSNTLENFRIPMLWLGGALAQGGRLIDAVGSQLDLASTLASQAGLKNSRYFPFSKNIFDTTASDWAYFSFNDGFGFVQNTKAFVFDNVGRQVITTKGPVTEKDIEAGKALQQHTFQDYIEK
ncbi:MAG TPA: sulfatase-like hydrolase/transferase [Flavisolibacter sp.]|nr:sulfatase-like hydrolase/transferase [Flavisolibacter sp.]